MAVKLCVCLGKDWEKGWFLYQQKADLLELRIDLMFAQELTQEIGAAFIAQAIKSVCKAVGKRLIITCRTNTVSQELRYRIFCALLPFSPGYIDLECDTPKEYMDLLRQAAQQCETKLIISYHNFEETPSLPDLEKTATEAFTQGADLVKIVTLCKDAAEEARLLTLYKKHQPYSGKLIAFSMGRYGHSSRLHAAALGAPIIYLASDHSSGTAPGQPEFSMFKEYLENV